MTQHQYNILYVQISNYVEEDEEKKTDQSYLIVAKLAIELIKNGNSQHAFHSMYMFINKSIDYMLCVFVVVVKRREKKIQCIVHVFV